MSAKTVTQNNKKSNSVFVTERGRDGGGQRGERNICQREDTENKLTDAQFKPCLHSNYSK